MGFARPAARNASPSSRRATANPSAEARARGLAVHSGHGLTLENVGPVAAIEECEELNIGHAIVSHAVFAGLDAAVRAMRTAMDSGRPR